MKPITISPGSLLLGVLLAVVLFLVMGQAGPGTPPGSWGPPKKSVVNVFETQVPTTPIDGILTVYQVPPDRWLTLTAASINPGAGTYARWCELHQGALVAKGFTSAGGGSTDLLPSDGAGIGWVFRPGSQVVVQNLWGQPMPTTSYALIGYESRD